jgi:hypothetical protein
MSTNTRIRVFIGLTVLGSAGWLAARERAFGQEPRVSESRSTGEATNAERLLLLTNGRIIKGVITEEPERFLVKQPLGEMKFPKRQVEGAFRTLHEAYEYRLEQLPERDGDERMKLAHWCLSLNMKAEAREQLAKVLELNSKQTEARAMLVSMDQAAALLAQRKTDPEVRQTSGESMSETRPAALDAAVIAGAQRGLNITGIPVIFDLPVPLAIKRTNEYFRYVHPVLQRHCAKCHDGNYNGEFQLVPITNRADRTADAMRANLDATLRLIDQDNPAKSELLTSVLREHGSGPRPRAIFSGSNDRSYQILSTWVQSLRHPQNAREAVAQQQQVARAGGDEEGFAVGRVTADGQRQQQAAGGGVGIDQRLQAVPGGLIVPPSSNDSGMPQGTTIPNPAAPDDFPLPFLLSGKMPPAAPAAGPAASAGRQGGPPLPKGAPAKSQIPPPNPVAGKAGVQPKATTDSATAKKKSKPVTIDPTLLERALSNRNAPQQ